MENQLQNILAEVKKVASRAKKEDYESLRIKYLGRRAELMQLLRTVKDLPDADKKRFGDLANKIKNEISQILENLRGDSRGAKTPENFDPTLPGLPPIGGHLHPITQMTDHLVELFTSMGYSVADGPEVELEKFNFDLLNIPADHPARDEWDTFWIRHKDGEVGQNADSNVLLRTHTSPVQLRYMQTHKPPIRVVVPGRTFRYEAEDATHSSTFNQFEGLLIDENISVSHLKATLQTLVDHILGEGTKIRLRPSFFPFTEPSFELDVWMGDRWLELFGAGMVHPQVLKNGGIDPTKYSGFAFGGGIDRLVLLKSGVTDIRHLLSGNLDFLEQF